MLMIVLVWVFNAWLGVQALVFLKRQLWFRNRVHQIAIVGWVWFSMNDKKSLIQNSSAVYSFTGQPIWIKNWLPTEKNESRVTNQKSDSPCIQLFIASCHRVMLPGPIFAVRWCMTMKSSFTSNIIVTNYKKIVLDETATVKFAVNMWSMRCELL